MALANRPDVLIADEPTTALDVTVQAQILNLIKDLQARCGMAVILITHDLTIVRQFAHYVYVMQSGEVKEHNLTELVFTRPQHPYTQHLLASEPKGIASPFAENSPVILEGRQVRVAFTLKRGGVFKPDHFELVAVDNLDLSASATRNARSRRRSPAPGRELLDKHSSGSSHTPPATSATLRQADPKLQPPRNASVAFAHADRLPGSFRLAESAHVGSADHRGRLDRK